MKHTSSKKFNKNVTTVYDFNNGYPINSLDGTPTTGTDPTNTTMTIITTVNTHVVAKS